MWINHLPYARLLVVAASLFLFPSRSDVSLSGCSCGLKPEKLEYEAPSAEQFYPEPRITRITKESGREVFHLSLGAISEHHELEEVQLRSNDGARTWTREGISHAEHVISPDSTLIYKLSPDGTTLERSEDRGQHWKQATLLINDQPARSIGSSSVAHVQLAAVHPVEPHTIFGCFGNMPHTDVTSATKEQTEALTGLYMSRDGGDHWVVFNRKLRGSEFEQHCFLGINPSNPEMMVGLVEGGLVITGDGGKNWETPAHFGAIESPAPLKGYAERLAQTKARGGGPAHTWPFSWNYLIIASIEFVPGSESVFYLVTNKGVYKTENRGREWCLLDTGAPKLFETRSVYVDERNPSRIFVGTSSVILGSSDAGCHFNIFFDVAKFSVAHKKTK